MKDEPKNHGQQRALAVGVASALMLPLVLIWFSTGIVRAVAPTPGGGGGEPLWLDYWSFGNTNTWASDRGYAPVAFTNLSASPLGNWTALVVDHTNAAWLQYNVTEADGTNNLTVERGTVMFWFAPFWSGTNEGGTGPGQWARLIEVGEFTTNASYGWWSVYTDPEGVNVYFAAQTNGAQAVYLAAPIAWRTNHWHLLALTYSATNTALYLDGVRATNGPGVTVWPGPDVLTNGFFIGSDSTGVAQARGMFDDLVAYDFPLEASAIAMTFGWDSFFFYMNPGNFANLIGGAGSAPEYTPTAFVAITGTGNLQWVGTNTGGCVSHTNIWLTNVVASAAANGTMDLRFTIAGGANAVPYDVFANSVLAPASDMERRWTWQGRGYHCNTYSLTNLPARTAFLVLGHPTDSDFDGLTDAYERLVSKTDPLNADTDGDGFSDGYELAISLTNPLMAETVATLAGRSILRCPLP